MHKKHLINMTKPLRRKYIMLCKLISEGFHKINVKRLYVQFKLRKDMIKKSGVKQFIQVKRHLKVYQYI